MNFGLYSDGTPLYAIFDKGEVFEQKYFETNQYDIYAWVKHYMTEETATPQPEPEVPVFYRMYPSAVRQAGFSDLTYNLGELSLMRYSYDHDYSYNCDSGRSLSKSDHEALYTLIGDTYGSDAEKFSLPDLSASEPINDLHYQIFVAGAFPEYISNDLYIGQVILAKNIDDLDFRGILVPCDGRKLEIAYYNALYTLIGDLYNLNTNVYFYIPDLSSASPIDGATYDIVTSGIYPCRAD
jgi:microcystin-dependent protein